MKGGSIYGEGEEDNSGYSVSLSGDGNIVAIGDLSNDVRIFEFTGGAWIQKGPNITGQNRGDQFGRSISLSKDGNTVAVGARYNDNNGNRSGNVGVYAWDGTIWVQKGQDIVGEAAEDFFGETVSLSGDGSTLAAGAPYNDDGGNNAGSVRIFQWDSINWVQKGSDFDGEAAGDEMGYHGIAFSNDGNIVALAAWANDNNGYNSGQVKIFEWDGTTWNQKGQDIEGENADDGLGRNIAMSFDGSIVAIGANRNDNNGYNSGHCRVFEWSGSTWTQKGRSIYGVAELDRFGTGIALSRDGSVLAIGALYHEGPEVANVGEVRVYEWSGGDWVQRGQDLDGVDFHERFGISVSLSDDGNTMAVGAPHSHGNGYSSGATRVYKLGTTSSQELESPHPYQINTRLVWDINIAKDYDGCAVLTMDPLSSTPSSNDAFLRIRLIDGDTTTTIGNRLWFGDKFSEFPETTVHGNRLDIMFKSYADAEIDYGFKLYISECTNDN